jgi:branched-chain amino acid transport system ATP-binding protein
MAGAPKLLLVEGLEKGFGAVRVAQDLGFSVAPGEALGIIGPNGAGKSSLFNLIGGALRPESGRILFDGRDITRSDPPARCRAGIARTFQVPQPFAGMSVFENLCVAASFGAERRRGRALVTACMEILERTGLLPLADHPAGALRLLDLKRLELARALAAAPRLLLLDEIAGGLTDAEASVLAALLVELRRAGIAIIWIEHVVHALVAVVDRLMVLDFGRKLIEGEPSAVMASAEVKRVYLGAEAA